MKAKVHENYLSGGLATVNAAYIGHLDKARCMKSGAVFMLRQVIMPTFVGLVLYGDKTVKSSTMPNSNSKS